MDALLRDLRFTSRMLAARPGWTVAAILCLAIATGANTAAFTIVNGLLLRPLPFDEPDQLVMVALREQTKAGPRPFALREYRAVADRSKQTVELLARTFFPLNLAAEDGARMTQVELVSGNYFDTLRVRPFLGRLFDRTDDRAGSMPAAVLSHRLWRLRFGSNPAIIGHAAYVNGRPVLIVGIAPPGFVGAMQLVAADAWLPASMYPQLAGRVDAETVPMFGVMGRLASSVTSRDAQARLTPLVAPSAVVVTPAAGFGVPPALQGTVLKLSGAIYVMMALLMIVACANVAALVLARGVGRTREVAVRLSLGASRLHIARQLIVESIALALAGCVAGSLVAFWLTHALVARLTTPFQYVSYAIDVHPDARVFAYTAIVTALAAVLCGIAPIRHAARVDVVDVLKQSAAKGRSRQSKRTLNAIVVMQFAVSTTLLVAAAMLVRRVPAMALGVIGLLGLLLSAVGLYGVVAYSVRERTRELGIRIALGARPVDVRWLVLRQGFGIVGLGLAIGAIATLVLARVVRSTLSGAGSLDPAIFAGVCVMLMAVGGVALYFPARWASRLCGMTLLSSGD